MKLELFAMLYQKARASTSMHTEARDHDSNVVVPIEEERLGKEAGEGDRARELFSSGAFGRFGKEAVQLPAFVSSQRVQRKCASKGSIFRSPGGFEEACLA